MCMYVCAYVYVYAWMKGSDTLLAVVYKDELEKSPFGELSV